LEPEKLSAVARAALFALLAEAGPVSNPDLEKRVGFRLVGAERIRLNNLQLVRSDKVGQAYVHKLTGDGRRWCHDELTADPGARATNMERALYAILGGLNRYLDRSGQELAEVFSPHEQVRVTAPGTVLDSQVQAVYDELAGGPGEFVKLHELRLKLPDIPREDLDSALDRMYQDQRINLVAQANQEALTSSDRESALLIGGSRKHLISMAG
jgi:hypothetical protein